MVAIFCIRNVLCTGSTLVGVSDRVFLSVT